jgi:hypothetical protein
MQRRDFITLLGGAAAAWPLAARAEQSERMRRIGWLAGLAEQDPEAQSRNTVIVRALRDLGWIVGRNLHIDYRYMVGDSQRFVRSGCGIGHACPGRAPCKQHSGHARIAAGDQHDTDRIRAST